MNIPILHRYLEIFGYVPQDSFYFNTTIIENIAFGEKKIKINKNKIDQIFNIVGINEENFGKNFENKLLGENGSNFSEDNFREYQLQDPFITIQNI